MKRLQKRGKTLDTYEKDKGDQMMVCLRQCAYEWKQQI